MFRACMNKASVELSQKSNMWRNQSSCMRLTYALCCLEISAVARTPRQLHVRLCGWEKIEKKELVCDPASNTIPKVKSPAQLVFSAPSFARCQFEARHLSYIEHFRLLVGSNKCSVSNSGCSLSDLITPDLQDRLQVLARRGLVSLRI